MLLLGQLVGMWLLRTLLLMLGHLCSRPRHTCNVPRTTRSATMTVLIGIRLTVLGIWCC